MQTAYSYIRFSTKRQALGDSERRQISRTRDWCERHHVPLDETLTFRDLGVSGFRGKNIEHGDLALCLEAIRTKQIKTGDYLIIESLDRLSRAEIFTAMAVIGEILKAGVQIVTLFPERVLSSKDADDEFTILGVVMDVARARSESKRKSDFTLAYWQKKRSKGEPIGNRCPAWLRFENGQYKADPAKVRTIQRIFQMAAEGIGTHRIAVQLHKDNVPCFGRGSMWNTSYLCKILSNPRVIGEQQHMKMKDGKRVPVGEPVKDYYPKVVDEKLFFKVQGMLRNKPDRFTGRGCRAYTNLFAGLLVDVRNGASMVLHRFAAGDTCRLLVNSHSLMKAKKQETRLPMLPFPYHSFEEVVLMCLRELTRQDIFPTEAAPITDSEGKKAELASVVEKIKLTKERMLADPDFTTLMDLLATLEQRRKDVQAEIDKMRDVKEARSEGTLEDIQDLIAEFYRLGGDERLQVRARLQSKIQQILKAVHCLVSRHPTGHTGNRRHYNRKMVCELEFRSGARRQIEIWLDDKLTCRIPFELTERGSILVSASTPTTRRRPPKNQCEYRFPSLTSTKIDLANPEATVGTLPEGW